MPSFSSRAQRLLRALGKKVSGEKEEKKVFVEGNSVRVQDASGRFQAVDPNLLTEEQARRNQRARELKLMRKYMARLNQGSSSSPSVMQPAVNGSSQQKIIIQQQSGGGGSGDSSLRRERAKRLVREQRVVNPLGAMALIIFIYGFLILLFPGTFSWMWVGWINFVILSVGGFLIFNGQAYFGITLILVAAILLNFGAAGDLEAQIQVWLQDIREKIGITNPLTAAKAKFYKTYRNFNNPDVVEPEPVKGIQILTFTTNEVFKEKTPVQIDAKVQIDGLYDSLTGRYERQTVFFSCYEENRKNERVQEGIIYINDKPLDRLEGFDQSTSTRSISCRFPQGMTIQMSEAPVLGALTRLEEGTEIGNKIVTKKRVVFEAHTRMIQIGGLKLWTVQDASAPDDITKIVSDPTLHEDGYSSPVCRRGCGGPYFLTLSTGVMPITEAKSPRFKITFVKNQQRYGTIELLYSLRLLLPQALEIQLGKTADEQPTACDFDDSRNLLPDKLKEANKRIVELLNTTEESTLSVEFSCGYHVGNPLEKLGFHDVSVRAEYDVIIRKLGLVEVYKDKPKEEETDFNDLS